MKIESTEMLYLHMLKDALSAEKQLVRALEKMAKGAQEEQLKEAFTSHREETRSQAERVEGLIAGLEGSKKSVKCKGIEGIIEEAEEILKAEGDPSVKDAAIIGGAQKTEHYEMAMYGTLVEFARRMGRAQGRRRARADPGGGEGRR
jgi:ferritin-like metal-binding protein YciE